MQIEDLLHKLQVRGGFETVNNTGTNTQLRILGRVPKDAMNGWLIVVQRFLAASEKADWTVDVSKQYFLKNEKVVFGWRLIFQGDTVWDQIDELGKIVTNAPRPRAVVDEQPLSGANPNRNVPSATGKGAQGVLKAAVGPVAVAQARAMQGG
jgi:hypothetical protein